MVSLNQRFGHPPLDSICPDLLRVGPSMMRNMLGGEITKEFAIGDFERSPPHLFLYLFLFKRKTKVEITSTLPVLNTGESKLNSNKK